MKGLELRSAEATEEGRQRAVAEQEQFMAMLQQVSDKLTPHSVYEPPVRPI